MTKSSKHQNRPAWLASQIALREGRTVTTVSRTVSEHLRHEDSCVSYVNGLRTVKCICQD
jgi:hypothetical protein